MVVSKNEDVIIVGAGCFGISTAYHLLQRGFTNVTVLDRSEELPAPDAASSDLNKVVRTFYPNPFYTQLAHDAIQEWKKTDEWGDCYRECGVLSLGVVDDYSGASKAYANQVALGERVVKLDAGDPIRNVFPSDAKTGALFDQFPGCLNLDSGWALATRGLEKLMACVITLGGKVVGGKSVTGLVRDGDGITLGVTLADGSCMSARLVVIATGSWTASTFRELELGEMCLSTGHAVAQIQLTEEEAARYRNVPVILDICTGFYIFPPTDDNIVKCAIHDSGVVHYPNGDDVSTPRTILSHGDDGLRVPQSSLRLLRNTLCGYYPELAEKPFAATRMCWYTDSPDDNWVIGYHPSDPGLLLATSGSGHAFKFLPIIGRVVADAIDGTLDPETAQQFSVHRSNDVGADIIDRRPGPTGRTDLSKEQLSTPEDLIP